MNTDYNRCKALYRAAWKQERASEADRQAVRLALTTAVTAGVHAATVGASAAAPAMAGVSAVGSKGILQLVLGGKFISGLLVGAALGSAGFVTSVAVQSHEASRLGHEAAHRQLVVESRAVRGPGADSNLDVNAEPSRDPASVSTPSSVPIAASPARPLARIAAVTATNQHPLAEETAALANVQDALNHGAAGLALSLLEQQDRIHARGQLGEERAAAKVLALCSAGRITEAEAARSTFLASHPNSPLTKRVSLGCSAQ